jgi:gluconokinase
MPHVPGLRSCYAKGGRLGYFGRMLDKIRLHAAGQLPAVYQANLGVSQFFVLAGASEEEALAWAHAHGTPRTDEECHVWNRFLLKLGWRDERSVVLPQRIRESRLEGKDVQTLIDHIEHDEGRDPVAEKAWENV